MRLVCRSLAPLGVWLVLSATLVAQTEPEVTLTVPEIPSVGSVEIAPYPNVPPVVTLAPAAPLTGFPRFETPTEPLLAFPPLTVTAPTPAEFPNVSLAPSPCPTCECKCRFSLERNGDTVKAEGLEKELKEFVRNSSAIRKKFPRTNSGCCPFCCQCQTGQRKDAAKGLDVLVAPRVRTLEKKLPGATGIKKPKVEPPKISRPSINRPSIVIERTPEARKDSKKCDCGECPCNKKDAHTTLRTYSGVVEQHREAAEKARKEAEKARAEAAAQREKATAEAAGQRKKALDEAAAQRKKALAEAAAQREKAAQERAGQMKIRAEKQAESGELQRLEKRLKEAEAELRRLEQRLKEKKPAKAKGDLRVA